MAIGAWFSWATQPVYYSYGTGGNVYYQQGIVYVDGQPSGTSAEYYDGIAAIADSVPEMPEEPSDESEWMPLGVFAVTQDGVNDSTMLIQLAVNKDGVVAGTLYNETTGTSIPLEGMVDKETQRVVWKSADDSNKDIVMETGLYNLTEDTTPVLVHFGPDKVETWTLVRIEEPERDAEPQVPEDNGGKK